MSTNNPQHEAAHSDIPSDMSVFPEAAQLPEPRPRLDYNQRPLRKAARVALALGMLIDGMYIGETTTVDAPVEPHDAGSSVSAPATVQAPPLPRTVTGTYKLARTETIAPSTLQGPLAAIDKDFRKALAVDSCETKVTPEDAMAMYDRLFGAGSQPSADPVRLERQATAAGAAIKSARQKLTFHAFPTAEYAKLRQDAFLDTPELPLSEYQHAITGYLAAYGVQTLFSWKPGAAGAPDKDIISPVNNQARHTDSMARRSITETLSGFSMMSQELLQGAGLKRVVFGDIDSDGARGEALGEVFMGEDSIYIDTALYDNTETDLLDDNESVMDVVAPHENTHLLHNKLCWPVINAYKRDNALKSLNHGIIYDSDLKALNDKAKTDGSNVTFVEPEMPHSTLEDGEAGAVIAASGYGLTNEYEDVATQGEIAFYGPNAENLYDNDGKQDEDLRPVREKMALTMARLNRKSPALANFYVSLLQAGRIKACGLEQENKGLDVIDALDAKYPDLQDASVDDPAAMQIVSQYNQTLTRIQTFVDIEHQMGHVLNGPTDEANP